jgi:hypothetical protein
MRPSELCSSSHCTRIAAPQQTDSDAKYFVIHNLCAADAVWNILAADNEGAEAAASAALRPRSL